MAECYRIEYRTRFGRSVAFKWGETPAAALSALQKVHGAKGGMLGAEYGKPVLDRPAPFTDDGRQANADFWARYGVERHEAAPAEVVELVEGEAEDVCVSDYHEVASPE